MAIINIALILLCTGLCLQVIYIILRHDEFGFYLLFTVSFTPGLMELCNIQAAIPKGIGYLIALLLFFKAVGQSLSVRRRMRFFGLKTMICVLWLAVISAMYNGKSLLETAVFLQYIVPAYLFFLSLLNLDFSPQKVSRFIMFWIAVQLPAILVKAVVLGVSEKGGIGTMSLGEGSVSVIFPMLVTCFLAAALFSTGDIRYVILIGCYVGFGLIGEKRAVMIFLPLTVFLTFVLWWKLNRLTAWLTRCVILGASAVVVIGFLSLYATIRVCPDLNPDHTVGGRFDMDYAADFATQYLSEDYKLNRLTVILNTHRLLSKRWIHYLIGFGPGDVTGSRFTAVDDSENPIDDKYELGYGGRTGAIWFWIQTGILSSIVYLAFHFLIFAHVFRGFEWLKNQRDQILALGFLASVLVFTIDYLSYSRCMIQVSCLVYTYYYFASVVIRCSWRTGAAVSTLPEKVY